MPLVRRFAYYLRSIVTLLTGFTNWPTVVAAFVGWPLPRPFLVQLRRTGLQLKVRSRMDVWIVKETCIDRDYERVGEPLQAEWRIIDIGAGIGDFCLDAGARFPQCEVHAYEPFPESFQLLQANLHLNALTNVTLFPEAINSDRAPVKLDVSGTEAVQHSTAAHQATDASIIVVPATILKEVLDRLQAPCDLLKMDCEGAEYDILLTADDAELQRIHRIVMEYHDNVVAHSHEELSTFLQQKGFQVVCYPSVVQRDLGFLFATKGGRK